MRNVKIILSPFASPLEAVDDLVVSVTAPYSKDSVTVVINPGVEEYCENSDQPGVQVRQFMATVATEETVTLSLDWSNSEGEFAVRGRNYRIKLMHIGEETIEGHSGLFLSFEFFVEEV